jgi:hypothetical protein
MAKFEMELPNDLIKTFDRLNEETEKMIGEMTQAGAQVVLEEIKANVPASFRDSDIMKCLHITKVYKTPSDGGINTKIAFYGYFINKRGVKTPAELVCNVMEYGRSDGKVKKHPFVRKSFNKKKIKSALEKTQDKYLDMLYGGD